MSNWGCRSAAPPLWSEASGAVADLGVFVPLATALVIRNDLDAATLLVGAGAFYIVAGLYFRVPVPVQPIKAASAIAIARGLPAETLAASGLILGGLLVLLGSTRASSAVARIFTKPVVRGLQLGVGLILVRTAIDLAGSTFLPVAWLVAASVTALLLARAAPAWPVALLTVTGGIAFSLVTSNGLPPLELSAWRPSLASGAFDASTLWSALWLLAVPQIPLTLGNAVVAFVDVERRYFGERSRRVTSGSASLSAGLANVASGLLGGMPMCHGSGGVTAHYRAGACTNRMNLIIGGSMLSLGLGFGEVAFALLALIPPAVLAGLLAFTGLAHAFLASDLRGYELGIAIAMGLIAILTSNLAVAMGAGLAATWGPRLFQRACVRFAASIRPRARGFSRSP